MYIDSNRIIEITYGLRKQCDVMLIVQAYKSIKIVSIIIYKKICIILIDMIEAPCATNAISLPRKKSLNTRSNK